MNKIYIDGQKATKYNSEVIVADAVGFVSIEFIFDSSWDDLIKVYQFKNGLLVYDITQEADIVNVPHETLVEGNLSITVRGIELDEAEEEVIVIGTTNPITYIVYPSGYTGSGTNVPPVTPTLYDQILAIATSAETKADSILASEELRVTAELARVEAEEGRVTNEGLRDDAEGLREDAETLRDSAEELRLLAEINRDAEEDLRDEAEIARLSAEATRISNEAIRLSNEESRVTEELARAATESGRSNAEIIRVTQESSRQDYEGSRRTSEITRIANESERVDNEALRLSAESVRNGAEAGRLSAEEARNSAEILRYEAEQTRLSNEGDENSGRVKAELDRVAAEEAREIILNAHIASPMPHKMLVDGVAYNYGLSQADGFVKFIYEEEEE